jgi:hypothetical protein
LSIEMLSALRLQETGVAAVYGVLLGLASTVVFWLTTDARRLAKTTS